LQQSKFENYLAKSGGEEIMNTVVKWIGAIVVIVVALVIIILAAAYIYVPDLHKQWVKPGIAQRKIPTGVDTSVVIENVTVIPMDSERVLEGLTVMIENGRIANTNREAKWRKISQKGARCNNAGTPDHDRLAGDCRESV